MRWVQGRLIVLVGNDWCGVSTGAALQASINKMAALLPEAGKHPEGPAAAKIKVIAF